ncbi:MAG: hypothetical protein IT470_06040 [Pseudomonadales bacterium]|nr:hypothetical protein [Pseudomonadales bacterium]
MYLTLKFIHLTAAAFFIGGVFFELLIVSQAAKQLDANSQHQFERALGQRAKRIMPWVILTLYAAGLALAGHYYRGVLAQPFTSTFGTLLTLKIVLALSIFAHFLTVMIQMKRKRLTPTLSRWIHRSVFVQMIAILFLAKGMFLL